MDVLEYNRRAWDKSVLDGWVWTVPVDSDQINQARQGNWSVVLTPRKPVPRVWFPDLKGSQVLCLASGGGQQAPIFSAAGANVTLLDSSPLQLQQDRKVAERDQLAINLVESDMRDLSRFNSESFDLVFHPVSNLCVPDVRPVWRECFRVLKPGGRLLSGFLNPAVYMFDRERVFTASVEDPNPFVLEHALPYSDVASLTPTARAKIEARQEPFYFSHTLTEQIGGQIDAGFAITGFYEDDYGPQNKISSYMSIAIATMASKLLKPTGN